jgi:phosphoglucomutase
VLQFILEDGSKISARPSGTEPKIKFYFSIVEPLTHPDNFEETEAILDAKLQQIIAELHLNS